MISLSCEVWHFVRRFSQNLAFICILVLFDFSQNLISDDSLLQKETSKVVVIDDYQDVPTKSESSLLKAVSKNPVSVAIEAGGRDFQHYQGVRHSRIF